MNKMGFQFSIEVICVFLFIFEHDDQIMLTIVLNNVNESLVFLLRSITKTVKVNCIKED